ncbi:MAG TPA: IS6 family transposase [Ktedonobacteraceae bacterium]|nr:IS6 family transposase [Ktedonobacteraceae bacterium]
MNQQNPFKWRHFESEIFLLCVRWYLRYALSYRDLEEMLRERGLHIDHTTIYSWAQHYAPELEKRCRPHLKACNDSWKVDETYIKVRKTLMYLYRAVDSEGNTLEFLLSPTREAEAAKRFFVKALHATAASASRACPADEKEAETPRSIEPAAAPAASGLVSVGMTPKPLPLRVAPRSVPRVINVDKNTAYPKAIADLKASGGLSESVELRQVKYLNNLAEQDHRFIKRLVKPGMGFFSVETAGRTLQGYEVMHMIRSRSSPASLEWPPNTTVVTREAVLFTQEATHFSSHCTERTVQ